MPNAQGARGGQQFAVSVPLQVAALQENRVLCTSDTITADLPDEAAGMWSPHPVREVWHHPSIWSMCDVITGMQGPALSWPAGTSRVIRWPVGTLQADHQWCLRIGAVTLCSL